MLALGVDKYLSGYNAYSSGIILSRVQLSPNIANENGYCYIPECVASIPKYVTSGSSGPADS
jgi:hypothetical protein